MRLLLRHFSRLKSSLRSLSDSSRIDFKFPAQNLALSFTLQFSFTGDTTMTASDSTKQPMAADECQSFFRVRSFLVDGLCLLAVPVSSIMVRMQKKLAGRIASNKIVATKVRLG